MIKLTRLKIKNIGMVEDVDLKLDKPLILFYGEIKQGKSTLLNAIRWLLGERWPTDIIRHGQKEASVDLEFDGGMVGRSWYRSAKGETRARDIQFVRGGKPVPRPATELLRFLNPFQLDQDYLRKMGEAERKKYFTELFAIDTSELDREAFNASREAEGLRVRLKGYGEIDLSPVPESNAAELRKQLADARQAHEMACAAIDNGNQQAVQINANIERGKERLAELKSATAAIEQQIARLKSELEEKLGKIVEIREWLEKHPPQPLVSKPNPPSTAELEHQIEQAAANEVRREQLKRNQERAKQRDADEARLRELEKRQREIKVEKIAALKGVTDKCGIPGLAFDEEGNFTYEGTDAGMLSTSQIMKLSSQLSAAYPEGFGIELMDRAESLGKSVFEFVERAKKDNRTILATIVGDAPAKAPAEVGVFVVENGRVTPCNNLL
ncbi:MAG: AAA family ATPase [Patescibacteria group bacterium]|nr:AAA family ATPase [Patescibacteria group bacterium]